MSIKAVNPFVWSFDFPDVITHTSICFLKNCEGFVDAKLGNMHAAENVVEKCAKMDRLKQIRARFPDAVLLPVITQNKLPLAYAKYIGMKVNSSVTQLSTEKRKKMTATERLLHRPNFVGKIVKNQKYVLVDDIVTQGGTISALRDFVVSKGALVVAVTALACAKNASCLAPKLDNVVELHKKFGLIEVLTCLEIDAIFDNIYRFTNAQILHILRFKSLCQLEKELAAYKKEFNQASHFKIIRLKVYSQSK